MYFRNMKREKLTKRIYNKFNLDKRLNKNLFVSGVYFGYFFVFYFLPIFINSLYMIYWQKIGIMFPYTKHYLWPMFSSATKLFTMLITQPIELFTGFSIVYFGVWSNILHSTSDFSGLARTMYSYILFAPLFIILPSFLIRKTLPKFKTSYLILLGVGTIILNNLYIYIYIFYAFPSW